MVSVTRRPGRRRPGHASVSSPGQGHAVRHTVEGDDPRTSACERRRERVGHRALTSGRGERLGAVRDRRRQQPDVFDAVLAHGVARVRCPRAPRRPRRRPPAAALRRDARASTTRASTPACSREAARRLRGRPTPRCGVRRCPGCRAAGRPSRRRIGGRAGESPAHHVHQQPQVEAAALQLRAPDGAARERVAELAHAPALAPCLGDRRATTRAGRRDRGTRSGRTRGTPECGARRRTRGSAARSTRAGCARAAASSARSRGLRAPCGARTRRPGSSARPSRARSGA